MSMQTLTWDVDSAAVNSDAYSLALATQARQKLNACSANGVFYGHVKIFLRKAWKEFLVKTNAYPIPQIIQEYFNFC